MHIFSSIVNRSIMASIVIVAVLIARAAIGKLPKKYSFFLWSIVAVRLLCPVGIASEVSVFNLFENLAVVSWDGRETVEPGDPDAAVSGDTEAVGAEDAEAGGSGKKVPESQMGTIDIIPDDAGGAPALKKISPAVSENGEVSESEAVSESSRDGGEEETGREAVVRYGSYAWLSVCLFLFLWNLVLLFRMRRRVSAAVRLQDNVYECDRIPSPFVMGFFRARIYIPFRLGEKEREYILKHERYHIRRRDNITKSLAFLLVCLYWFNPLVWVSYVLMIRDMEMSCDEYVLQTMSYDVRKEYSHSLLAFAMNQRRLSMGFLAFGESDTRRRVRNVMKFRKSGKIAMFFALFIVAAVGAVCLTDAKLAKEKDTAGGIDAEEMPVKESGTADGEDAAGKNEKNADREGENTVAAAEIHGFRLELMDTSGQIKEEKYYAGDGFYLRTTRDGKVCDERKLDLAVSEDGIMYFPVEGLELGIADYDGDGQKDDFALGQGQTIFPPAGNFMKYKFYGVEEDGTIAAYQTSSGDRESICCLPGDYSPVFKRRKGEVVYTGLDGGESAETLSTSIIRTYSADTKREPEHTYRKGIETNMPAAVVEELKSSGTWHVSRDEEDGTITYSLGNEAETLRLDFTCRDGKLLQYVSKEYGFVDSLPEVEKTDEKRAKERIRQFAEAFTDAAVKRTVLDDSGEQKEGSDVSFLFRKKTPKRYDDGNHAYYLDMLGSAYVYDRVHDMVVAYELQLPEGGGVSSERLKGNTPVYADLDWDGKEDKVTVDFEGIRKREKEDARKVLTVTSGKTGEVIWEIKNHGLITESQNGEMAIYIYPVLGKRCALGMWIPVDNEGACEFYWKSFHFKELGQENGWRVIDRENEHLSVDLNHLSKDTGRLEKKVKTFFEQTNTFLSQSRLVLNTIPDGKYGSIPDNGIPAEPGKVDAAPLLKKIAG